MSDKDTRMRRKLFKFLNDLGVLRNLKLTYYWDPYANLGAGEEFVLIE